MSTASFDAAASTVLVAVSHGSPGRAAADGALGDALGRAGLGFLVPGPNAPRLWLGPEGGDPDGPPVLFVEDVGRLRTWCGDLDARRAAVSLLPGPLVRRFHGARVATDHLSFTFAAGLAGLAATPTAGLRSFARRVLVLRYSGATWLSELGPAAGPVGRVVESADPPDWAEPLLVATAELVTAEQAAVVERIAVPGAAANWDVLPAVPLAAPDGYFGPELRSARTALARARGWSGDALAALPAAALLWRLGDDPLIAELLAAGGRLDLTAQDSCPTQVRLEVVPDASALSRAVLRANRHDESAVRLADRILLRSQRDAWDRLETLAADRPLAWSSLPGDILGGPYPLEGSRDRIEVLARMPALEPVAQLLRDRVLDPTAGNHAAAENAFVALFARCPWTESTAPGSPGGVWLDVARSLFLPLPTGEFLDPAVAVRQHGGAVPPADYVTPGVSRVLFYRPTASASDRRALALLAPHATTLEPGGPATLAGHTLGGWSYLEDSR